FVSSRRRHTRSKRDWSSDVCSSDLSLIWGLLIGLVGSWLLANNVKKQTYQLEPYEISRIVEERSTIMETLDMGIITTDEKRTVRSEERRVGKECRGGRWEGG